MNLSESLSLALEALSANKLRAALTMLGIVIGVAAVITLVSVGEGVTQLVTKEIQGVGSNLLFVFPGNIARAQSGGARSLTQAAAQLTYGDAKALSDPQLAPDVLAVAAEYSAYGQASAGSSQMRTNITGVTPNYAEVRNFHAVEGQFISEEDLNGGSRVAVIGQTVAEKLYPDGRDPIDQVIKLNRVQFRVIGVLEKKGGSGFGDQDNIVLVPFTSAQAKLFQQRSRSGDYLTTSIYAQAVSELRMAEASDQIANILRDRHGIVYLADDDFTIVNQTDLLDIFGQITGVLTVFLGAIAAISLLVGGIGIMNIMLVSVTERTREIGLRKAVGAKRRDIMGQFLMEAIMLSLIGGLIGIALGSGGARLIARLSAELQPVVSLRAILLATGFSAAVGLFFGLYPATRASRLNPIDALRYE